MSEVIESPLNYQWKLHRERERRKREPACPYRHFDENGVLLYVGATANLFQRLQQHSLTSHWFNRIARIEIEHFPTREAALTAERDAIRNDKPLHNVVGRAA